MTRRQKISSLVTLHLSLHQNSAPKIPAQNSGDSSAVVPPVPIPNTAVKRCSPDGSTAIGRARVGRRQNNAHWVSSQWAFFLRRTDDGRRPKTSSELMGIVRKIVRPARVAHERVVIRQSIGAATRSAQRVARSAGRFLFWRTDKAVFSRHKRCFDLMQVAKHRHSANGR